MDRGAMKPGGRPPVKSGPDNTEAARVARAADPFKVHENGALVTLAIGHEFHKRLVDALVAETKTRKLIGANELLTRFLSHGLQYYEACAAGKEEGKGKKRSHSKAAILSRLRERRGHLSALIERVEPVLKALEARDLGPAITLARESLEKNRRMRDEVEVKIREMETAAAEGQAKAK